MDVDTDNSMAVFVVPGVLVRMDPKALDQLVNIGAVVVQVATSSLGLGCEFGIVQTVWTQQSWCCAPLPSRGTGDLDVCANQQHDERHFW